MEIREKKLGGLVELKHELNIELPEGMVPSLSGILSLKALCSCSCVPGLSAFICFPAVLVKKSMWSWKWSAARNKKEVSHLIKERS